MNENAKKWVAALRSGEYDQVTGSLGKVDKETKKVLGYCCLGVACEVALKEDVNITRKLGTTHISYQAGEGDVGWTLPNEVRNWLGLSYDDGAFEEHIFEEHIEERNTLVELNDEANFSFEQIADVIESEPEGLFDTNA